MSKRHHHTSVFRRASFFIALGCFAASAGFVPLFSASAAGNATLSLSPASDSYSVGKTFTVSVMLNSGGGVGVNAADGELSFDPTLLSVQSVSKGNSIFNLWTSNPSFSNTAGTVDYSGGSNDTYTGSAGDVVDITFKALAAGSASVKFASASALAADGQGTNVLGGNTGATYTLGGSASGASAPAYSPPASSASQAPAAANVSSQTPYTVTIAISSPTHPSPTQWYSNNSPSFTWTLTPDVAGVSVVLDQISDTYPKRSSQGLLSSKQYSNLADGAWYFHARFEDSVGDWSDPVNFQVNIDTASPNPFTVTAAPGAGVSGRTNLLFSATDTTSGIDHYIATFDGAASSTIALSDLQNGVYTAMPLLPGDHVVQVAAFDKAGNYTTESAQFSISGVAMPEITNFPATVIDNSPIVLEGTADSGSNVTVDLNNSSGKVASEGKMVADQTGHWLYAVEGGLSGGKYSLLATMVTTQGAIATSSNNLSIDIISAPFLDRFGWILIILLLACISAMVTYGFYWKKIHEMQLLLAKRENDEARERTKIVFEALREEVDEKISHMEGGAAQAQGETKLEPENVLDAVRNALVISETTIQKEIEDVDKALNEE
jgi:hypothetical protein